MKPYIHPYPFNNDCAFIVTIDDLHPEEGFGLHFSSPFWKQLEKAKSVIPHIVFTLFTVADWIDKTDKPDGLFTPLRKIWRQKQEHIPGTFRLSAPQHKPWVTKIKKLEEKGLIEIGYHGLYHHNELDDIPTSQEFISRSPNELTSRIKKMLAIFEQAGFKHPRSFRPPGWGIPKNLLAVLYKHGITSIAPSADFAALGPTSTTAAAGLRKTSVYYPTSLKEDITSFTANCYPHQYQRAIQIAQSDGVIVVHCHISQTVWGLQYVNDHFADRIIKMVHEIKNQTMKHIWFTTPQRLTDYRTMLKDITIKKLGSKNYEITFSGKGIIEGLTVTIDGKPYIIPPIKRNQTFNLDVKRVDISTPLVSIILTVYNGAKNVIPSLQSLCAQTYPNLEIIVVNDGSNDRTKEVLQEYIHATKDKRIIVHNQTNQGRSKARNNGFKLSHGEIVTFCEDDALYDKDYISNAVPHFARGNSKLGGVIGPHYVWNKLESLNTRFKDIERRRNFYRYIPQSCWFYQSKTFKDIGMFPEDLELVEDIIPALRLKARGYKFKYEEKCRWLHKEPADPRLYLRRKFRGGIGMALLHQTGLRKLHIPLKFSVFALGALIMTILLIIINPVFAGIFSVITIIGAGIMRGRDIKNARIVSDESLILILMGVYVEYIWWFISFMGFLYGLSMKPDKINSYLRGR